LKSGNEPHAAREPWIGQACCMYQVGWISTYYYLKVIQENLGEKLASI